MKTNKRIGFLTASTHPDITSDDGHAVAALESLGISACAVVWDTAESAQEIDALDAVVFRACWNYHRKPTVFLEWVAALAARGVLVQNAVPTILWNADKRYLRELATRGIAVPKTAWLEPGSMVRLDSFLSTEGLDEVVVKPAVSMSGDDTWRCSRSTAASLQPRLDALLRDRRVMVQAFVPEILHGGEVSLVYFSGRFSHAVRKRPRAGEFRIHEEYGGRCERFTPEGAIRLEADAVLAALPEVPLYARVDGVESDGRFVLMELEVIDPVLFFGYEPEAAERFARATLEWLNAPARAAGAQTMRRGRTLPPA